MIFDEESTAQCQAIINRLAKTFQSVPFAPHITLSGTPDWPVKKIKAAIEKTIDGSLPLELKTTSVRCSSNPYQKLTHGIHTTDELTTLHQKIDDCFEGDFAKKEYPHISYLYSKLDCEVITRQISPFQKETQKKIIVNQLALVHCKGTPEEWRTLYKWDL